MKRALLAGALASASSILSPAFAVDYVGDVLPIMKKHCWDCHSQDTSVKGNLALDPETLSDQIGTYNIIRPGNPAESGFVERMKLEETHADFMPRKGSSLPKREIETIEEWIRQGAVVDAKNPTEEEEKRLAAAKPAGPATPENPGAAAAPTFLSWTNLQGRTIEARFLGLEGAAAKLLMRNGKSYLVPLDSLDSASADQARKLSQP